MRQRIGRSRHEFVGRNAELARGKAFLSDPDARLLVVDGVAGIGKTAFAHALVCDLERELDAQVVFTTSLETETDFAFGALADVAEPLLVHGLDVPAAATEVIETALGLRESTRDLELMHLARAMRALLAAAAADRPVVVVFDDIQWIDPSSARVFAHALRRMHDLDVRVVATLRTSPLPPADLVRWWSDLVRAMGTAAMSISLDAFDATSLAQVVFAATGEKLTVGEAAELHRRSGGNPFQAVELVRMRRDGINDPNDGRGRSAPRWGAERVLRTSPDTRRLLAALALSERCTAGTVTLLCGRMLLNPNALDEALDADVVRIVDGWVEFTHPLLRQTCRDSVDEATQRELHAKLAVVVSTPAERAQHRALSSDDTDPGLTAELVELADNSRRLGASHTAAYLLDLAIGKAAANDAAHVAIMAAMQWNDAGETARALATARRATELARTDADLAAAELTLGSLHAIGTNHAASTAVLESALGRVPAESPLASTIHLHLASTHLRNGYFFPDGVTHADLAQGVRSLGHPGLDLDGATVAEYARMLRGLPPEPESPIRTLHPDDVVRLRRDAPVANDLLPIIWLDEGRFALASQVLDQLEDAVLADQDLGRLAWVLNRQTEAFHGIGDCIAARDAAHRAYEIARRTASPFAEVDAMNGMLLADLHYGDLDAALERAGDVLDRCRKQAANKGVLKATSLLIETLLARGEYAACAEALTRMPPLEYGLQFGPRFVRWCRITADVSWATGDQATARKAAGIFTTIAARRQVPWALASAAALGATIDLAFADADERDRAVAVANGAIDELRTHAAAVEVASRLRMLVVAAQRSGAADAVTAWTQAHRDTERLINAEGWLARTDDEILDLTELESKPRVSVDTGGLPESILQHLTPGERGVVGLVARGLSNREVAAELFVSVRTVETHLTSVYRKLGVTSRARLQSLLASTPF